MPVISLNLSEEVFDLLVVAAAADRRSRSSMADILLSRALGQAGANGSTVAASVAAAPASPNARTKMCPHRIPADAYCKICDA